MILFSSIAVSTILKNKVEKHTDHLIRTIISLTAIPVYWLWMSNEPESPKIFSFYLPLFVTIFAVAMFIYAIIKYNKSKL